MKAMVFAAGLGTRLRPLTDSRPKALVEVKGVTMLERVLRHLISYGFDEIVVNVHHFGDQIIEFLKAKNNFGITIHISDERENLLDTGGGILKAWKWLDGNKPILIHNADILSDLDLNSIYDSHLINDADATLLVDNRNTTRYLLLDDSDKLKGWTNISTGEIKPKELSDISKYSKMAFGGIHVISPKIFESLLKYSAEPKFSITPFYVDNCNNLKIMGYKPRNAYKWFDIGKLETLALAEKLF